MHGFTYVVGTGELTEDGPTMPKGLGLCQGLCNARGLVPDIPSPVCMCVCVCVWRLMVCRQTGTRRKVKEVMTSPGPGRTGFNGACDGFKC